MGRSASLEFFYARHINIILPLVESYFFCLVIFLALYSFSYLYNTLH